MLAAAVPDEIGNGEHLACQLRADGKAHVLAVHARRNGERLGVLNAEFIRHALAQRLAVRHTVQRPGLKAVAPVYERAGLVRRVAAEKVAHGEQGMGERTVGERGDVGCHTDQIRAALSGEQRAVGERHNAVPVGRGGEIFPRADRSGAVFGMGKHDGKPVGGKGARTFAVEADAVVRIVVLHGVPCALVLPDVVEHRLHAAGRGVGVPGEIDRDRCGLPLRQSHGVAAAGEDLHIVGGETVAVGIRLRAHLRGNILAEIVAVEAFAGIVQPDGEREHFGQTLRGVRHAFAVRLRGILAEGAPIRGVKRQNVPECERFHGKTARVGGERARAQQRNKQQYGDGCGKNTICGGSACGFHDRLPRSWSELVA